MIPSFFLGKWNCPQSPNFQQMNLERQYLTRQWVIGVYRDVLCGDGPALLKQHVGNCHVKGTNAFGPLLLSQACVPIIKKTDTAEL